MRLPDGGHPIFVEYPIFVGIHLRFVVGLDGIHPTLRHDETVSKDGAPGLLWRYGGSADPSTRFARSG